ncbi:helix-turn-helix domain-containing protein [Streptomyces sp. Amel2xC10]|uniref:helix-turn-helix domain-containing protein n=1 Tax=Streptomyces sp. Amel2xC10 TaxID=1305826 RepID=UPI000D1C10D2|nr:helix-turn-helix transcriptional regulator [Streptomyces sp. Amel2xC10]
MNENPSAFRRRRIEAGLSVTELARKAGVTKSHLSYVELGKAGFSPRNLKAIATVLGCTIPDLLLPEPDSKTEDKTEEQSNRSAA